MAQLGQGVLRAGERVDRARLSREGDERTREVIVALAAPRRVVSPTVLGTVNFIPAGQDVPRNAREGPGLRACVGDPVYAALGLEDRVPRRNAWNALIGALERLAWSRAVYRMAMAVDMPEEVVALWRGVRQHTLDEDAYEFRLSEVLRAEQQQPGPAAPAVPAPPAPGPVAPPGRRYGGFDLDNFQVMPARTPRTASIVVPGTQDTAATYYEGVPLANEYLEESVATPSEVAEAWDRLYADLGITDRDAQRFVRANVLVYAINNGTTGKLMARAVWQLGDQRLQLNEILGSLNQPAGTFRRTMRGMAREARFLLSHRTSLRPAWGRKHGMDVHNNSVRIIAFDFADCLEDLSPAQRAALDVARQRALAREESV